MRASQLRELQRPLKDRYAEDPRAAVTAARATARIDIDAVTCQVAGSGEGTTAGLHPAAGGSGQQACSADMLLEALVACAGVTLASVATAMSLDLTSATVTAEGHWDARGTLAVDRSVPVGLTDITLRFDIETDADAATVERLITLTERYCVIAQTLASPPQVTFARGEVAAA